jgi:DNA anti-recombination protein RmuC
METLIAVLALLLGAVAGWIARDRTLAHVAFETSAKRVPELEAEVNAVRSKVEELTVEASRLETELGNQQKVVEEKEATLANLRSQIEKELKNLMGQHVVDVGTHLGKTVNAYNSFVGSLASSGMPQGRKFHELEVEGTQEPLKELSPVETVGRSLSAADAIGLSEHNGVNTSSRGLGTNV